MSAGGRRPERRPPLTAEQQARVEAAMPMIRRMARALAQRRPGADVDALASAGGEALVRSVASYDPERNDQFEGYAWERAFRAMLDELSAERSAAAAAIATARRAGIALAGTLRDETDPFADARDDLEQRVGEACDEVAQAFVFGLAGAPAGAEAEDRLITRLDLRRVLARLAEADRRLLELRYGEQRSLRRVAATLGVSRSKVARRARELLDELRRALVAPGDPRAPVMDAWAPALDLDP